MLLFLHLLPRFTFAQTNISGIINSYAAVTNLIGQTATVVSTTGFSAGDKVMIIQMKGTTVNLANTINYGTVTSYNDAGNYEMATISTISGNQVTFSNPLIKTYSISGLVQLVRVATYPGNVNVTAMLTCPLWNGATGGVLCFEASGNITLNAAIDVSGKGFRGGIPQNGGYTCAGDTVTYVTGAPSAYHGQKGEGVFINSSAQSLGKGKNANGGGGGNDLNAGGAGGGNYGAGGHGGDIKTNASCPANFIMLSGGIGGQALPYSNSINKIYLGGGGGCGQENDNTSLPGSAGGGIVLIRSCTSITGNNNYIRADGIDQSPCACIDGQAGGGGGGSVLIDVPLNTALNISVKGGTGGSDTYSGPDCHGKGGGGGAGIVWVSNSFAGITTTLSGGAPGLFLGVGSNCYNTSLGATAGASGGTLTGLLVPGATALTGTIPVLSSATICPNQTVTLTASGGINYTWTPTNLNTASIQVSPAVTTVYSVVASSTNACNYSGTATLTVSNNLNVTIASTSTAVCSGQSATLTASGATTYTWLPSNQTGSSLVVTPGSTQTYTVLASQSTCSALATQIISVAATPTITIPATSTTLCLNQSFSISVNGATNYTWLPTNFNGPVFSATPLTNTTYTVIGSNGVCSSNTLTFTANVIPLPIVTINPLSATICPNQPTLLTASGAANYTWTPGGSNTSTILVSPGATTIYSVIAAAASGCTNSGTSTLTVSNNLSIAIAATSTTVCSGQTATLTASGATTYTWLPSNQVAPTISITPGNSQTYTVLGSQSTCTALATQAVSVTITPTISLSATGATLCPNQSFSVLANGASNYTWIPNNINGPFFSAIPLSNTVYTVIGSNSACMSNTLNYTASIMPLPILTVSPANATVCPNEPVTLTASGGTSYTWQPNNSVTPVINVQPSQTTNYSVTAANAIGCLSSTVITVIVNDPLTLNLNGACVGESATLTSNGMLSYTWQPSNISANTITVSPPGTTVYTVTGYNNPGCVITKTISVTLLPKPAIVITQYGATSSTLCSGMPYQLSGSGANTYTWLPSGTNNGTEIFYPTTDQTYTLIGSTNGCKNSATISVTVSPSPVLNITATERICKGENALVSLSGASQYTCITTAGIFYTNPFYFSPGETNTITVIGKTGNCTDTKAITINVSQVIAGFTDLSANNYDFDVPINFVNTSVNNFYNEWDFGNGQTSNNTNPVAIYSDPGDYLIQLVITDTNGCKDGVNKKITIGCNNMQLYIPNSFTPNGDGKNDVFKIIGLMQCIKDFKCEVFDRWGEKIKEFKNSADFWDGTYKGKIVENDVYIYKVSYTDMRSKTFIHTGHVLVINDNEIGH